MSFCGATQERPSQRRGVIARARRDTIKRRVDNHGVTASCGSWCHESPWCHSSSARGVIDSGGWVIVVSPVGIVNERCGAGGGAGAVVSAGWCHARGGVVAVVSPIGDTRDWPSDTGSGMMVS